MVLGMGGPEIERLIGLLAKLPGMGPRSARRAALQMLQQPEARMLPLAVGAGRGGARGEAVPRCAAISTAAIRARSAPIRSATAR